MNETTLVIGDYHDAPEDTDKARADHIATAIQTRKPHHIVFIGYLMTVDSMSAWDHNSNLMMEGRRFKKDIDSMNESLDRMLNCIDHMEGYKPSIYITWGNHEDRINRYIKKAENSILEGMLDIEKLLKIKERGITTVPYKQWLMINGVGFTHIPFNNVSPIGSAGQFVSIPKKVMQFYAFPTVYGHTHRLEYAEKTIQVEPNKWKTIQSLNCGSFLSWDGEDYMKGNHNEWTRCLVMLHHYEHGRFNFHAISRESLDAML